MFFSNNNQRNLLFTQISIKSCLHLVQTVHTMQHGHHIKPKNDEGKKTYLLYHYTYSFDILISDCPLS